ncbi:SRPBCC family protein [Alteromonas sp. D210916BOD_24]
MLDHENLDKLFNASFKVVKSEEPAELKGGVGCVREVKIMGLRFFEEIIRADASEIRYRVLNDFPVKAHLGVIRFLPEEQWTQVHYHIRCKAPWYLPSGLLRHVLMKDIKNCLDKLGAYCDPR